MTILEKKALELYQKLNEDESLDLGTALLYSKISMYLITISNNLKKLFRLNKLNSVISRLTDSLLNIDYDNLSRDETIKLLSVLKYVSEMTSKNLSYDKIDWKEIESDVVLIEKVDEIPPNIQNRTVFQKLAEIEATLNQLKENKNNESKSNQ